MMAAIEIEPEKFRPNIKSIKFLGSGEKTRVGQVSRNNNFLRPSVVGESFRRYRPFTLILVVI